MIFITSDSVYRQEQDSTIKIGYVQTDKHLVKGSIESFTLERTIFVVLNTNDSTKFHTIVRKLERSIANALTITSNKIKHICKDTTLIYHSIT